MKYCEVVKEIKSLLDSGYHPVVCIKEEGCNEFFPASPGMLAKIVDISTSKDGDGVEIELTFDFSEFFENNKPLFSHDYYNPKTEKYDLTAIEAGMYPENHICTMYVGCYPSIEDNDVEEFVLVKENDIINEWMEVNKKDNIPLIDWLIKELKSARESKS